MHRAESQGLNEEVNIQDMEDLSRRGQGMALGSTEDRATTLGAIKEFARVLTDMLSDFERHGLISMTARDRLLTES